MFGALYSRNENDDQPTLTWLHDVLTIDWQQLPARLEALLHEVEDILDPRASRISLWDDTYDFVAKYVEPSRASKWKTCLQDNAGPEALLDAVMPDEFPLGVFYSTYLSEQAAHIIEDVF